MSAGARCDGASSVNRSGRVARTAVLMAAFGGLLAGPLVPARADVFDHTLLVQGREGAFDVLKGTIRIEWNLPDLGTGRRPWQLRVGTRALTCGDDSTALVDGAQSSFTGRRGHHDLDLSGPLFAVGAHYFVRACMPLERGRHHATNQIEVRVTVPVAVGGIHAPLPGSPQITGTLAATPVRPGYWIGVTGRDFGERPGRLLLDNGTVVRELSDLDWHGRAIAGRVPGIEGVPDGPAFLIVERADHTRSSRWSVNFVATREVRMVSGGDVHIDSCSDEADSNGCGSGAYTGAPSFGGGHHSIVVIAAGGESGTDQYSIVLADGWRFHGLEYSHGNRSTPPRTTVGGGSAHPQFQVHWRNPEGFNVSVIYGFHLYVVGPVGTPYRR